MHLGITLVSNVKNLMDSNKAGRLSSSKVEVLSISITAMTVEM